MPAVVFIVLMRRFVDPQRCQTAVRRALGRGGDGVVESGEAVEVAAAAGPGALGRVGRAFVALTLVTAVTAIVGQLVARRLSYGDESSDDVRLAVIMGGAEFSSFAPQLRSASAIAFWAGLSLDLRDASLGPGGADLELRTIMGGVEVRVPDSWRVEIDQTVSAGEFEVDLPGMEGLPDDAPVLRIRSVTTIGGGLVTSTRG